MAKLFKYINRNISIIMIIVVEVRGRQAAVRNAVDIIGKALSLSGLYAQGVLTYNNGFVGYVKADKAMILSRQPECPDFLLCIDESVDIKHAMAGIKEKGIAILNAREKPAFPVIKNKKIKPYVIDATGMSMALPKKPKPYFALLGIFTKLCGTVSMKSMKTLLPDKESSALFDEGYKAVKS